jgi:hypothetical protein
MRACSSRRRAVGDYAEWLPDIQAVDNAGSAGSPAVARSITLQHSKVCVQRVRAWPGGSIPCRWLSTRASESGTCSSEPFGRLREHSLDPNETRVCRGDDVSRGDVCELGGGEDREAKGVQQCKDKEEGGKAIHQSRRGLSKAWKGHDKRDQRSYEDEGPLKVNM